MQIQYFYTFVLFAERESRALPWEGRKSGAVPAAVISIQLLGILATVSSLATRWEGRPTGE